MAWEDIYKMAHSLSRDMSRARRRAQRDAKYPLVLLCYFGLAYFFTGTSRGGVWGIDVTPL